MSMCMCVGACVCDHTDFDIDNDIDIDIDVDIDNDIDTDICRFCRQDIRFVSGQDVCCISKISVVSASNTDVVYQDISS